MEKIFLRKATLRNKIEKFSKISYKYLFVRIIKILHTRKVFQNKNFAHPSTFPPANFALTEISLSTASPSSFFHRQKAPSPNIPAFLSQPFSQFQGNPRVVPKPSQSHRCAQVPQAYSYGALSTFRGRRMNDAETPVERQSAMMTLG